MSNTSVNNTSVEGINTSANTSLNRPNRCGSNNPMYGRHHSQATRQKQSDAAIRRNQEYKKALDNQHHITMDEFLSNNPTVEQYIKTLVRESIEKFLWKEKMNQRISIPL